jgi:phosphoribosylanthranilate isomerase
MFGPSRSDRAVQIKICGITNSADAIDAVECGADALGFNLFQGSRRFVDLNAVAKWIPQLPGGIPKVAVMVSPSWDEAMNAVHSRLFDSLQLHGDESPEFCRKLTHAGVQFTKALPITGENSLIQFTDFHTPSILLDSRSAEGFGGTGRSFPWSLAYRFIADHPHFRVILAGGLTPENVVEAIATAQPAGVDVTSGVEASVGRKDRRRLAAFISAARGL